MRATVTPWALVAAVAAGAVSGAGSADASTDGRGGAGWRTGCDVLAAAVPLLSTDLVLSADEGPRDGDGARRRVAGVQALRAWARDTTQGDLVGLPSEASLCDAARASVVSRQDRSSLFAAMAVATQLTNCTVAMPSLQASSTRARFGDVDPSSAPAAELYEATRVAHYFHLERNDWAEAAATRLIDGLGAESGVLNDGLTAVTAAHLFLTVAAHGPESALLDTVMRTLPRALALAADLFIGTDVAHAVVDQMEIVLRSVAALGALAPLPETAVTAADDLVVGTIEYLRMQPIDTAEAAVRALAFLDAVAALPVVPLLVGGISDSFRVPMSQPWVEFTVTGPLCTAMPPNVAVVVTAVAADADLDADVDVDEADNVAEDDTTPPVETTTTKLNRTGHRLQITADRVGTYAVELSARTTGSLPRHSSRHYTLPRAFEVTVATASLSVPSATLTVASRGRTTPQKKRTLEPSKSAMMEPLALTTADTLRLGFIVETAEGAPMSTAHQAFLRLQLTETGQDVYFLARNTNTDGYLVELNISEVAAGAIFDTSGIYTATLIVGDARSFKGVHWRLGELIIRSDAVARPHSARTPIYAMPRPATPPLASAEAVGTNVPTAVPVAVRLIGQCAVIALLVGGWWRLVHHSPAPTTKDGESYGHLGMVVLANVAVVAYLVASADVVLATIITASILTGATAAAQRP